MYILSCLCFWKHVVCTVLYVCDDIFIVRYQTMYVCMYVYMIILEIIFSCKYVCIFELCMFLEACVYST